MIVTLLDSYYGAPAMIACDGHCTKAWGINNRPRVQLSDDPDDWAYVPDQHLGRAPDDPGTYEGGCAKPTCRTERHNKWCARECERSKVQPVDYPELRDFSRPYYNQPLKHLGAMD